MKDYIIRGMAADNQVRFFGAYSTNLVERGREIHNTSPVATAALGRLLSAGALMGSMCKNEKDLVTLRIQCQGPIGGLTVTSDSHANVKGYVNIPNVIIPANEKGKLDVAKAIDLGILNIIKDIGLKEPYIGQTHLISSEIAEDLTYYFATSEQIPTSVALGVLMEKNNTVKQAGGFIIQLMPFASDELITDLENKLATFDSITSKFESGMTIETIIKELLDGYDVTITDTIDTAYKCDCNKDKVEKAIISIGRKEIAQMIEEDKPIEVDCQFCDTKYNFTVDELQKMLFMK